MIEPWRSTPLFLSITPTGLAIAGVVAAIAWLVLTIGLRIARGACTRLAAANPDSAAQSIGSIIDGTSRLLILLTAILIGVSTLALPAEWSTRARHLWFLTLVVQFALWCNRGIEIALARYFRRASGNGAGLAQASATSTLLAWALHTALWAIVLLAILSNLGVNISAFVASLGVGGIAIALAAQNILGDLFASLSIAIDKPFEVGDSIGVGAVSGTVERIGLKTTRLRSASGEEIVMSNTDLLKQTIRNFRRMSMRRIVYPVRIGPEASAAQVARVPQILRRLIEADPNLRFDRAHLLGFGERSIDFECVFHVRTPDYQVFMDSQQALGLGLMRAFADLGINFASASQTVYRVNLQDPSSVSPTAGSPAAGSPAAGSPAAPGPAGPA